MKKRVNLVILWCLEDQDSYYGSGRSSLMNLWFFFYIVQSIPLLLKEVEYIMEEVIGLESNWTLLVHPRLFPRNDASRFVGPRRRRKSRCLLLCLVL
jgi:hypothetical protein